MNNFGKTIKLFLIDGEPNGRLSCELSNWTGKAYKIPRKQVKESSDRDELKGTGIYILFGKGETDNRDIAYIGEAEEIYKRLLQHLSAKDFWNEVVIFISKDENLNKAHIKYIESRLYEIAIDVNRYDLENGNFPPKPKISESDQAEMEEFISNIKLLVNTLGYKIFEYLRDISGNETEQAKNTFYLEGPRGANASGQSTNEGFVVIKGSTIALKTTNSFSKNWLQIRGNLIDNGIIIEENNQLTFSKDYLFRSPSAAAAIVLGRSANGLTEWKLKNGQVLKSIENN